MYSNHKPEAELQHIGKVTWLTSPVSKNWVYDAAKYVNAPWENINSPAKLAVSMTAHVGEDGPVVVTVGITTSTGGGPLFTPLVMGSTRTYSCADLPDSPLDVLNVREDVAELLTMLNIAGCWQVFVNTVHEQEETAKKVTEM